MSIESVMPSNHLCHPLSSVIPFSCLQYFPASGPFLTSQLFTSGGQSIWASASASVLPMNIQVWLPLGLTIQGTQESSPTPQFKSIDSLALSILYGPTLTSIYDFLNCTPFYYTRGFPGGASSKESPANLGNIRDLGSIPGSGRSLGVGNGNLLQYSCLESSMGRGAWWATVHVAEKIWTQLSKWHFHFHCLLNQ